MSTSGFCEDPLWDWDLTWALNNRTDDPDYYGPDFTTCFQQTVLVWIPCAFLWLIGAPIEILSNWGVKMKKGLELKQLKVSTRLGRTRTLAKMSTHDEQLHRLRRGESQPIQDEHDSSASASASPWTKLAVAKFVLGAILVVVHILILMQLETGTGTVPLELRLNESVEVAIQQRQMNVMYTGPIYSQVLRIATLILAEFLLLHGKHAGIRSSGPQFVYWFLATVCEAFPFRTTVLKLSHGHGLIVLNWSTAMSLELLPLTAAVLVLNCWADFPKPPPLNIENGRRPSPEASASFLSRILFMWVEPMLYKGYRTPLDFDDLWELGDKDKASCYMTKFEEHWKKKRTPKSGILDNPTKKYDGRLRSRARSREIEIQARVRERDPNLLRTLWHVFGASFLVGASCKFVQDCMIFVPPQILNLLVSFVEGGEETWKGVVYVSLLLISSLLQSLFLGAYFHRMFVIGMRAKATIMNAVYRKALRISNAARKESTVGEIVNLMSVDVQNIMDLIPFVNMLWSAPFQIGMSLYFLWQTLGYSVLAGLGLLMCLVPLNIFISSRVKRLQMGEMRTKDHRVKLMNEILSGIKVLKMYAWEPSMKREVLRIRAKEMDVLKISVYLECFMSFVMHCSPFVVALFTAGTYVLADSSHVFDASKAFVSLTLFNIMRTPLKMLPMVISNSVKASVSLQRLNNFLNMEEIPAEGSATGVTHIETIEYPIVIQSATFAWEEDVEVLRNINLTVKEGSLVAIVGPVGSGKSSLLAAMLGELPHAGGKGHVNTKGSIAYVAQQAWIQGASLQDNILFGSPLDVDRYDRVVEACALLPDLAILPAGDQTEIGEKGINLSGGQKQRVALARAAYNDADVYLLDDPFSALDAHVGKHVFEQLVGPKGLLRDKTRVLVTHGLAHLPLVDRIIVLYDGEIVETGAYSELLEKKGEFAEFLMEHMVNERGNGFTEVASVTEEEALAIKELQARIESRASDHDGQVQVQGTRPRPFSRALSSISAAYSIGSTTHDHHRKRTITSGSGVDSDSATGSTMATPRPRARGYGPVMEPLLDYSPDVDENTRQNQHQLPGGISMSTLVKVESTEKGSVKTGVYMYYVRSVGVWLFIITIFSQMFSQAFEISSNVWLAEWSSNARPRPTTLDVESNDNSTTTMTATAWESLNRIQSLGIYACLGLGQAIFLIIGSIAMAQGLSNASNFLHLEMLDRILKAPMSFFDQTPTGRIVNRFGKDLDIVDSVLPLNFRDLLFCIFNVASTLFVICFAIRAFIIVLVPVSLVYWFVQRYYVASSRQLKRMEAVSRSPIYSHFSETITGLATIRGFAAQKRFTSEFEAKVDRNHSAHFPFIVTNRWLSIRLESIANLITFFSALFAVLLVGQMDAGFVGLAIAYALQITSTLNWVVRMTAAVETNIVAVERIKEYTEVTQEAEYEIEETKPNEKWPENGTIAFHGLSTRYREGLDLVLDNVTCKIEAGEKIGIVGRTGAGKSSITLALFRIIEPTSGSIHIDDLNISRLGLFDLRSRLTIIPQDPVLFSGSLRLNLDPFQQHSDVELWKVLELANLKHFVKGLHGGLQYEIVEGGENLSVGQRQQICLARALLRRTRILVLDEATASVDLETDNLIQHTIRREFVDATVLTIAHRLKTIMDSTRIMVLDNGTIKEFESPEVLLRDTRSTFYSMAKNAGLI